MGWYHFFDIRFEGNEEHLAELRKDEQLLRAAVFRNGCLVEALDTRRSVTRQVHDEDAEGRQISAIVAKIKD